MPWKECSVTEERLRFVARLLDGEGMSEVCRSFGISRKTGYKIFNRYKEEGLDALCDRSRRPVRYANQLPDQVERLIVDLKRDKPHWGARKIRELLLRRLAGDVRLPAKSTVHAVLDRHGLVKRARERRNRAGGTPLSAGAAANDLWCADFKGEFKLGNGRYCYPLTVSDHASRYLLLCEAFESTREAPVIERRIEMHIALSEPCSSVDGCVIQWRALPWNHRGLLWIRPSIAISQLRDRELVELAVSIAPADISEGVGRKAGKKLPAFGCIAKQLRRSSLNYDHVGGHSSQPLHPRLARSAATR
jgi:transposase